MPDTNHYIPITLPSEGDFICDLCGFTITRSEPAIIKTDAPYPDHRKGVFMHKRCTTPLFVPKGKCCGTCHWMQEGKPDAERRGVLDGFCKAPVPLFVHGFGTTAVCSDQGAGCPCWTDVPLPFKTLDKLASAFNTLFCFVTQATPHGQNWSDEERKRIVQAITESFDLKEAK